MMMAKHMKNRISVCIFAALLSSAVLVTTQSENQKKGLAILGDAWHAVAPLYKSIVKKMEASGYEMDVTMDNSVPFDKLAEYDIIVISRYGYDNINQLKQGIFQKAEGKKLRWISPKQEDAFERWVKNGGHLFMHHDGHCYYSAKGGIERLAKTYHGGHPPKIPVTMKPTGLLPELTQGITPFTISDEEFRMDLDESKTTVFLESYSEANGRTPQGWAHDYGKGKVVVLVPGHDRYSLEHPMVDQCISNIVAWLSK
jgi:type 1 glutamine amidotransferase